MCFVLEPHSTRNTQSTRQVVGSLGTKGIFHPPAWCCVLSLSEPTPWNTQSTMQVVGFLLGTKGIFHPLAWCYVLCLRAHPLENTQHQGG